MLRLYLTRHGQTESNLNKIMQGWHNSELTELGKKQAQKLHKRIKHINFLEVYTSPIKRAVDTAKIVSGRKDVKPLDNLKEIGLGVWEGKSQEQILNEDSQLFKNFWENPHFFKIEKGESFHDVKERAKKALDHIISKHDDGNVLIVAHAAILNVIMLLFNKKDLSLVWQPPVQQNTALNIIEIYNSNDYKVVLEGSTYHLDKF
ncbi:MAG: histidine phosphatase family protein [Thermotogota bacterium]